MKEKIHISPIKAISSENREIITSSNLLKEKNISVKEQIEPSLINRKSSLEVLFKTIKNFQKEYFSKANEKDKLKSLKKSLTSLQSNLTEMKKEKMKQVDYLKTANENHKKRIQGNLFPENENNMNSKNNSYLYYLQQKKDLNLLNFQIENEIEKTNALNTIKNKIYLYIKNVSFYLNLNRQIFCNINQKDSQSVSEILKHIRTSVKNKFISTVKQKMETNLEINAVKLKLKYLLDDRINEGKEKYIEPEEIIYEEEKENDRTLKTNKGERNSYAGVNKFNFSKNILKRPSNNLNIKHLSIDAVMEDNFYRNKLINLFLKKNEIINNYNNNPINNILNINVNINLEYKKYNGSKSSSENEDDQAIIELVENNSIDVSYDQTEEDI